MGERSKSLFEQKFTKEKMILAYSNYFILYKNIFMYIYIYLLIEGVLASLLCQDGKFRKLENIFFLLFIISNYFGCFRDGIGGLFTYVMHFQNISDITELTTSDFLLLEPIM